MRGDEGEEGWQRPWMQDEGAVSNAARRYLPGSTEAQAFAGWGTALKPAFEPVVVARKPIQSTVAANVLAHGTGALNIDACRIEHRDAADLATSQAKNPGRSDTVTSGVYGAGRPQQSVNTSGRWPANVVLDESQATALDEQSGESSSVANVRKRAGTSAGNGETLNRYAINEDNAGGFNDIGGASRFFYVAKADASERPRVNGTAHPTVKPLDLMRWLVRLVTPPGGTVLEPFAGSGTTVEACIVEGFQCIAIEREADYLPLIRQRIDRRRDPVEALRGQAADLGLFDLLGGEGA
jgi:site-specific DNA-methyltransferase (adenine-specific)